MLRFLVVRLSLIVLTLLVVSMAIFTVTEVLPGDVAWHILGQGATPENLEVVREKLDLIWAIPTFRIDLLSTS